MSIWLLILCLLVGDLVVAYCWWRECRAHARSRRALHFWRDYRRGAAPGPQPTAVPLSSMDSDHGMAAVRAVITQRLRQHQASRSRADIAGAVALMLLALASVAWAQQAPPTQPPPTVPPSAAVKAEPAPAPPADPDAPMPIPQPVAQEVQRLQAEMMAHQASIQLLQDRIAALSSRVNQTLTSVLPAGRVLGLVCRDGAPACEDGQKMLMMVVPPEPKK